MPPCLRATPGCTSPSASNPNSANCAKPNGAMRYTYPAQHMMSHLCQNMSSADREKRLIEAARLERQRVLRERQEQQRAIEAQRLAEIEARRKAEQEELERQVD